MPNKGKVPDFKFGKTINSYADKSRQKGRNLLIFAPDKYSTRENLGKFYPLDPKGHHAQTRGIERICLTPVFLEQCCFKQRSEGTQRREMSKSQVWNFEGAKESLKAPRYNHSTKPPYPAPASSSTCIYSARPR